MSIIFFKFHTKIKFVSMKAIQIQSLLEVITRRVRQWLPGTGSTGCPAVGQDRAHRQGPSQCPTRSRAPGAPGSPSARQGALPYGWGPAMGPAGWGAYPGMGRAVGSWSPALLWPCWGRVWQPWGCYGALAWARAWAETDRAGGTLREEAIVFGGTIDRKHDWKMKQKHKGS